MGRQVTRQQRERLLAVGLAIVALAVVATFLGAIGFASFGVLGDLEIYAGAIRHALSGGDLYSWKAGPGPSVGMGFTYPPFAALLLSWLAMTPLVVAKVSWTLASFAVLTACLWLLTTPDPSTRVGAAPSSAARVAWISGLLIPVVFTYPFVLNLMAGQVSLFVIALTLFDHTLPPRWRGVLVGLAASIKLTPLVFVAYYLVTRQWRAAAISSGTFAGATILGGAVLPQASLAYWTTTLWQGGRIGRVQSTLNKSLLGLVTRSLGSGTLTTVVWLALAVVATVVAFWHASRAYRGGDPLGATLVVGALSVAVSPFSWAHHLLWLVLMMVFWLLQRGRRPLVLALVLFAVFLVYPAFDDYYVALDPVLAVAVELPVLATLLVLGFGPRPGSTRAGLIDASNTATPK